MCFNFFIIVLCLGLFGVFCDIIYEYDELLEGSECITDDGVKGTCADIHKCMQYVQHLKNRSKHPQMCSYDGNVPIVCCSDCELVNDTSNILVDRFGLHYFKTGRIASDKCLEYLLAEPYPCNTFGGVQRYLDDERSCYGYTPTVILSVAGGMDAEKGQYPHMALLGYGDEVSSADWLCGGTLISHRYVLTAAHCKSTRSLGSVKYIALGIHRRSDPPESWELYNVQDIIVHPDYKPPSKYHDIALLVTDRWVKFTHLILPACLDTGDTQDRVAFATGWGSLGHQKTLADTLQTVTLSAYSEAECTAFYPPHRTLMHGYNHTSQMCYGDKDLINDTCEGDSGGPLQVHSELSSCAYTVIGVTSYGKSCGSGGGYGVYSRVSYYLPWIESTVWK